MKKIVIAAALVLAAAAPAMAQQGVSGSTNGWTNAQKTRAEAAVRRAGFTPGAISYAQAGSIFINATRRGEHFLVTVSQDGKVHPGLPTKDFKVDPKSVVQGGGRGGAGVSSGD